MPHRPLQIAALLEQAGEVEVCLRKIGVQLEGPLVRLDRPFEPPGVLEHHAQVEVGNGVSRLDPNRRAVVGLRTPEVTGFVAESA